MSDIHKTQHYTTEAMKICGNLVPYIPPSVHLIEPFAGKGDLVSLFPSYEWRCYDIQPQEGVEQRDTLLNPPDYKDKWVITNPPYLAKNKTKDKTVFEKFHTDDLYKAAMLSLLDCSGGILIIPTNFFSDERSKEVRKKFLDRFSILELNVFTEPVFNTTTYSVCSFAFQKREEALPQTFTVNKIPDTTSKNITIYPDYNYRIGGEVFDELSHTDSIFGRLVENNSSYRYITNIYLIGIDKRGTPIHLERSFSPYYGKTTDRVFATLTCDYELSEKEEEMLIVQFNDALEKFRQEYFDLCLTNYRDYNRKRIGFEFCYQLLTNLYWKMKEKI